MFERSVKTILLGALIFWTFAGPAQASLLKGNKHVLCAVMLAVVGLNHFVFDGNRLNDASHREIQLAYELDKVPLSSLTPARAKAALRGQIARFFTGEVPFSAQRPAVRDFLYWAFRSRATRLGYVNSYKGVPFDTQIDFWEALEFEYEATGGWLKAKAAKAKERSFFDGPYARNRKAVVDFLADELEEVRRGSHPRNPKLPPDPTAMDLAQILYENTYRWK